MLVWLLFGEQPLRAPGEFEEAYAFVQVTLVRSLMQSDFLHQFLLLDAPLFRHLDVEGAVYAAIELVDVHCVNAVLESLDLGLQTDDSGVMLLALIRVALTQGSADPLQYLVAEVQLAEDLGKFLGDDLFPHVALAAFPLVAGAVVIDVAALLKFPYHGAATMPAIDKAREGEIALAALELARIAGIEDALDALP